MTLLPSSFMTRFTCILALHKRYSLMGERISGLVLFSNIWRRLEHSTRGQVHTIHERTAKLNGSTGLSDRCLENCFLANLRSYGISILIKHYLHAGYRQMQQRKHRPFTSFMVDSLICLEMSTKHFQMTPLRRGMNSESSSYNQQELRPQLQHMNAHLRTAATETSSLLHIILILVIGYLYVMKLQISSSQNGTDHIKSSKKCYWERIDCRILVGLNWRR